MKKVKKKITTKITLEKLASMMSEGFEQAKKERKELSKQAKQDNEDLAAIAQQSFNEVNKRLTLLERSKQETNDRLSVMGRNQEEIKLRLTNVAYRFELDELQNKVQKIEDVVLRKKR